MIGKKSIAKISLTLKNLIKAGESENSEFKLKVDEDLGKTICAFANTNGGSILIGINNKGNVIGCYKKDEEKIANIASSCIPAVRVNIEKIKVSSKTILKVDVQKSKEIHSYKNIVYKRVGSTNRALTPQEVVELAQRLGKFYWDSLICEEATLEDIDEEKVRWLLKKAKIERNFDVDLETPLKEALERLGLIKDRKLTNAAILLFGKKPQKFFLQARIRCARYKGVTPLDFIDLKIIDGNIIDQVDNAEKFVLSHIKKAARIVMFKREEVWEYPPRAIREAIVNAVCHRDYNFSSDITIGIFDNRLEITNPGKLPEPLTPADLKKQHKSIPRNPLIANAFFLIKNIEQWGKGTNKIVDWCKEHGLKEPDFEEIAGGFLVKFYVPEDVLSLVPEPTKVDLRELGLNERQIEVLRLMINEGKAFTNKTYRELFKVSNQTCVRDMRLLKKLGFVMIEGRGKSVRYKAK